jgi:hypothetical protein
MDGLLKVFLLLAVTAGLWWLLRPVLPKLHAWIGNWRVHYALRSALPASHYSIIRDPDLDGQWTASMDHVVVSPYGVFVIATQPMSGYIAGAERDANWTQTRLSRERTFPNPLCRNRVRIETLCELLQLNPSCFHSLVVFTGHAEIGEGLPANVTQLGGMLPFVQVRTSELLGFEEAERVVGVLESRRPPPGIQTAAARLVELRKTHGSRFSARQAVLGLGLMATLLAAAGSLAHRLGEASGQHPAPDSVTASGPFLENAPPPRIELPGVAAAQTASPANSAAQKGLAANGAAVAEPQLMGAVRNPRASQADIDKRLAWESSLKCGYAADSRRCSCYGPQGRKAALDYDSCRALADRNSGRVRE